MIVSIKKPRPGDAMVAVGNTVIGLMNAAKALVIVDDDARVRDINQVIASFGSRWQPWLASQRSHQTQALPLDPSIAGKFWVRK